MIQKKQKKLTPKQLSTVIAASVLVFLIILYASVSAIIGALEAKGEDGGDKVGPEIIESIGESTYAGQAVAYPHFRENAVQNLDVEYTDEDGVKQNFGAIRYDLGVGKADPKKDFIFYYTDAYNNREIYLPPIVYAEKDFNYTSLYGTDNSIGYDVYKLTYMMVAVGALYFDERMPLPTDSAERERALNRYGLGESERKTITVTVLDGEENTVTRTIHVGDLAIDGSGYYFTIEGRDYIYNSLSTNFSYVLNGFVSLISSRLIAQGRIENKTWEPYFTTDLKQWKNTLHDNEGDVVPTDKDAAVIVKGSSAVPLYGVGLWENLDEGGNGYGLNSNRELTLRLNSKTADTVAAVLRGAKIKDAGWQSVTVTDIVNSNFVSDGARYTYTIRAIESHFTDREDITDNTAVVGDSRYVKVTYDYTVQTDKSAEAYTSAHAVIDMQKLNTGIPQEVISAIKGMTVGTLAEPLSFEVTYTEDNADKVTYTYLVKDIVQIFAPTSTGGYAEAETIGPVSLVSYSYALVLDGVELEAASGMIDLSKVEDGGINGAIKESLIGKKVGLNQNIKAYEGPFLLQNFMDFVSYDIDSVEYYVTEELITSLEFVNASERAPFYGESLYKNTLTGGYGIYALDSTASEAVARLLGGIGIDSSSTTSEGLVGIETVAVGLTPANMKYYGLYENTIYFEIPRTITPIKSSSGNDVYDYFLDDKLGFTLYISREHGDGSRYVGSDMYDVIAKVSDERWAFLDMSFVDYWARKTLAAVSYSDIERIELGFYMDDLYGEYNFKLDHNEKYIYDGKLYDTMPEEGGQAYDQVDVKVSASGDASDTLVKRLLDYAGEKEISLTNVYLHKWAYYDSLGTENFKTMLSVIFNTHYTGTFSDLTKEEKAALKEDGSLAMRFAFKIKGEAATYGYDFYRIDDRRYMVSLYRESPSGTRTEEVHDFFISAFAFKKIARCYLSLLNGEEIDEDEGYPEISTAQ